MHKKGPFHLFQHNFTTFTFIPLPDAMATLILFLVILFLQWSHKTFVNARKPGVDFGHDNDPLSGVRQELRGLVPHRRLRAVPRITAEL